MKSSNLNSRTPLRRTTLKKVGPRTIAWQKCRAEKVKSDIGEDGLIKCEDWKLGQNACSIARLPENMDLHHSEGRDGKLLTDKTKLVWLTRECHDEAHN